MFFPVCYLGIGRTRTGRTNLHMYPLPPPIIMDEYQKKGLPRRAFSKCLILKRMGSGMTTKPQDVQPKISVCSPRDLPTAGHNDRTELSTMINISGCRGKSRAKSGRT